MTKGKCSKVVRFKSSSKNDQRNAILNANKFKFDNSLIHWPQQRYTNYFRDELGQYWEITNRFVQNKSSLLFFFFCIFEGNKNQRVLRKRSLD